MRKILMLDRSGLPIQWATFKDFAFYYSKDNILWKTENVLFTILGGTNNNGDQTSLDISSIFAITGNAKALYNNFNDIKLRKRKNTDLFNRDMHVCAYCGIQFVSKHLSRDHIHPVSKGGNDEWMNVVTACKVCNQYKDDKLLEEAKMKLLYIPYVPNASEKLILENKYILSDQMDYLLQTVPKNSKLLQ